MDFFFFFVSLWEEHRQLCVYKCVAFCGGRRARILYKGLLGYEELHIISGYLTENCKDESKYI